jgi:hypothetical protein
MSEQLTLTLPAELLDALAEALADRLAAKLATQGPTGAEGSARRLLTMDELVTQLPVGKSPKTWKRWLYERTRRNQVPGGCKIGGRLFFDSEQTIPWLTGQPPKALDVVAEQSLDQPTMPAAPENRRRSPG